MKINSVRLDKFWEAKLTCNNSSLHLLNTASNKLIAISVDPIALLRTLEVEPEKGRSKVLVCDDTPTDYVIDTPYGKDGKHLWTVYYGSRKMSYTIDIDGKRYDVLQKYVRQFV